MPHKSKFETSPAEVLALRAIVTALVVIEARRVEAAGFEAPEWMKRLRGACVEIIQQAEIDGASSAASAELKTAASSCLKIMLDGISFGASSRRPN
jgi:hypothetical protein